MKLHWSPRSPFVRKVMVFAHETGLADRIELLNSQVAMTQPNRELMRDNPLSKIPTLLTDAGEPLYDSTVICEYLDSLHGGRKLFPAEGEARWRALRWHALGDNLLDLLVLWRNERLRPPPQRSQELLDAFRIKLEAVLDDLERKVAALAAGPFGIGQIAIGCGLGYVEFRFAETAWRRGRPAIHAWYEQFAERPSAKITLPSE
jgi:glutathione S-transferase